MQLNRTIPPATEEIRQFHIIEASKSALSNGIPAYCINAGTEEALRIDLYFDAGVRAQQFRSQANLCSQMLIEGTNRYSAGELTNAFDYYGAFIQSRCYSDDASISLYCLREYAADCLNLLLEVLTDAAYPEPDFETIRNNSIQKLSVNEQKNSYLSRRYFYAAIYGKDHPYGSYSSKEDLQAISREHLYRFYQSNYRGGLKYVLLAGKADDSVMKHLDRTVGALPMNGATVSATVPASRPSDIPKHFIKKPDSLQSALRIGRELFSRNHPDFRKMQLLNLILGGFFGSRLMKNLREDKGLTYGIHSALESFKEAGCFFIDTEMNNKLREKGLHEIYSELERLRTELVSEDELSLAKNYMLGSFLRSIDGPFSLMERFKILLDFGLDYSYYYDFPGIIKSTTAADLRELAWQYLEREKLVEIVVGN